MKKQNIAALVILLIVLVIFGYVFQKLLNTKPKTDWDDHFHAKKEKPFDLKIFINEIDSLLPHKKINKYNTDFNKYINSELNPELTNQTVLVISHHMLFSLSNIESFIAKGNDVFIITKYVKNYNLDYTHFNIKKEQVLQFTNPKLKPYETKLAYAVEGEIVKLPEPYKIDVLGTAENQNIFVRYKIGKGSLYMHCIPRVFSNHYLVTHSVAYPSAILSYIKQNEVTLIADGLPQYTKYNYKEEDDVVENEAGLLSFILSNNYLKSAWYVFIIGGLLFIVFRAKRQQRIIPIWPQKQNKSLEFVKTISSIYYNDKNNLAVLKLMNAQFLEKIEKQYNIKSENLDRDFILKLASITGVSEAEITKIVGKINYYTSSIKIEPSRTDINEHYINLKKLYKNGR